MIAGETEDARMTNVQRSVATEVLPGILADIQIEKHRVTFQVTIPNPQILVLFPVLTIHHNRYWSIVQ